MTVFDDDYFMNIGPSPSIGIGMGRLIARLDGELVSQVDAHIGFSHRGIEKCMERFFSLKGLVYADKLNRSAPFSCSYAFVRALEKLEGIQVPRRAAYIRVILAEAGRILSHLRATANLAAETGTDMIYPLVLRASAKIGSQVGEICGGCPNGIYIRQGGVANDVSEKALESFVPWLTKDFPSVLSEIEDLLTENRIFKSRTVGIGKMDASFAVSSGFSGVNLRACGVEWDLRSNEPYDAYDDAGLEVPVRSEGDAYSRYLLRIFEIYQSVSIIGKLAAALPAGEVMHPDFAVDAPDTLASASRFFEYYGKGRALPRGEVYAAVESPLGEFGVFLVSDGSEKPYRCHFRSAGFPVMQALDALTAGYDFADVRVILASLNIITTETDR